MNSAFRAISVALIVCMITTFSVAHTPQEDAWSMLNAGLTNKAWEKRVKAVRVLGELTGNAKAEEAALTALKDEREDVRAAAAQALGDMGAKSAIPQLLDMLNDTEPLVILAAHSLINLGDNRGYSVYYAVLTGERKTGTSLIERAHKMLKDRKKMAALGFQAGLGFVPYGGLAVSGFKMLTRDDTSPVLAAAALTLAKDPDPKSGEALANAAITQEKWLVRAAAFDAIAKRGDPSLKSTAVDGLQDQEEVQYSAAGAVIRLSDIEAEGAHRKPAPAKRKTLPKKTR